MSIFDLIDIYDNNLSQTETSLINIIKWLKNETNRMKIKNKDCDSDEHVIGYFVICSNDNESYLYSFFPGSIQPDDIDMRKFYKNKYLQIKKYYKLYDNDYILLYFGNYIINNPIIDYETPICVNNNNFGIISTKNVLSLNIVIMKIKDNIDIYKIININFNDDELLHNYFSIYYIDNVNIKLFNSK
jgi:hypothetical protein